MAINDVRRLGSELHHYLKPIGPMGPAVRGRFVLTVDGMRAATYFRLPPGV